MIFASDFSAFYWYTVTFFTWIALLAPGVMAIVTGWCFGNKPEGAALVKAGKVLLKVGLVLVVPVTLYLNRGQ